MLGKKSGVIALIMKDDNYEIFLPIHCVIHCEHLAAMYIRYDNIMKTVLEIVNCICSREKTHLWFRIFLEWLDEDIISNDTTITALLEIVTAISVYLQKQFLAALC